MAIQPTLFELQVQMAALTASVATISLQLQGLLAQQQQRKAHLVVVLPISEPKTTPESESASSNRTLVDLAGFSTHAHNMFDENPERSAGPRTTQLLPRKAKTWKKRRMKPLKIPEKLGTSIYDELLSSGVCGYKEVDEFRPSGEFVSTQGILLEHTHEVFDGMVDPEPEVIFSDAQRSFEVEVPVNSITTQPAPKPPQSPICVGICFVTLPTKQFRPRKAMTWKKRKKRWMIPKVLVLEFLQAEEDELARELVPLRKGLVGIDKTHKMFEESLVKGNESYDETNMICAIQWRATSSKKLRLKAPTTWKRRKKIWTDSKNYGMETMNLAHFKEGRSLSPTSLLRVVPRLMMAHEESDLVMLEEDNGSSDALKVNDMPTRNDKLKQIHEGNEAVVDTLRGLYHNEGHVTAVMESLSDFNGLLILYYTIRLLQMYYGDTWEDHFEAVTGYGVGGTTMALFGKVEGDIYTIATYVGSETAKHQFILDIALTITSYEKLTTCFLSHPFVEDNVKEIKKVARNILSSYDLVGSGHRFAFLLGMVGRIYQKEPELLYVNEALWTFMYTAEGDHTCLQNLEASLSMLIMGGLIDESAYMKRVAEIHSYVAYKNGNEMQVVPVTINLVDSNGKRCAADYSRAVYDNLKVDSENKNVIFWRAWSSGFARVKETNQGDFQKHGKFSNENHSYSSNEVYKTSLPLMLAFNTTDEGHREFPLGWRAFITLEVEDKALLEVSTDKTMTTKADVSVGVESKIVGNSLLVTSEGLLAVDATDAFIIVTKSTMGLRIDGTAMHSKEDRDGSHQHFVLANMTMRPNDHEMEVVSVSNSILDTYLFLKALNVLKTTKRENHCFVGLENLSWAWKAWDLMIYMVEVNAISLFNKLMLGWNMNSAVETVPFEMDAQAFMLSGIAELVNEVNVHVDRKRRNVVIEQRFATIKDVVVDGTSGVTIMNMVVHSVDVVNAEDELLVVARENDESVGVRSDQTEDAHHLFDEIHVRNAGLHVCILNVHLTKTIQGEQRKMVNCIPETTDVMKNGATNELRNEVLIIKLEDKLILRGINCNRSYISWWRCLVGSINLSMYIYMPIKV